jgi:glycosyltransferase involved in cell wall biosynthesis
MKSPDATRFLSRIAVVIPAFNEVDCLPLVLEAMPTEIGAVIVVDNGSTDGTSEIATRAGATVIFEPRRGYGQACQAGIQEAAKREAEVVIIMDGDHSFDARQIQDLAAPIFSDKADMVLGDRTTNAEKGAMSIQQKVGNRIATFLILRVTGHRYRDMGPFRAIRTDALLGMSMEDRNFGWTVEMQIKAVRDGLRVLEIPVRCKKRPAGDSKISGSVRGSAQAGWKMMRAVLRYAQ